MRLGEGDSRSQGTLPKPQMLQATKASSKEAAENENNGDQKADDLLCLGIVFSDWT